MFIESLQGLAAARTAEETTTLPVPQAPHIPTTIAGEEEAILWEKVGTGHVLPPEVPPTRTPPQNDPTQGQTREDQENPSLPPLPPKSASIFTGTCSKQQRTYSLSVDPAIFDLLKDNRTTSAERMNTLESLPRHERPALLIIVEEPTHHV